MAGRIGAWWCGAAVVGGAALAASAQEYRTYDGTGNNLQNPLWGSNNTVLVRACGVYYGDGVSGMGGQDRPNPRVISNIVCAQEGTVPSSRLMTNMVMQWGQWIDHDLGFRKRQKKSEFEVVPVPQGDPWFDPEGTGEEVILFSRSRWDQSTGTGPENPRQQINVLSSYLDCNTVYGFDRTRADFLRSFEGGRLLVSSYPEGDLLPWNEPEEEMDFPPSGVDSMAELFLAGDDRANEQVGLAAMHALWVREHNRLADGFAAAHPEWDDERVYQEARRMVIALNQAITYNEFLPALLGTGAVPPYAGYKPWVNPGEANEFAHAAYRFAHSMLNPHLARLGEDWGPIPEGHLALRDAFFAPRRLVEEGGIEPLLRGMCAQGAQEIDHMIVDDVRNFLFGPPGPIGLDLAVLNIQRGRDHGLPSYNQARTDLGMEPASSFDDVSSDQETVARLAAAYPSVDELDLWLGGISEDKVSGAAVGPVFRAIMVDTFARVRDGDRFWYQVEGILTPEELAEVEATTLADVILRNTSIGWVQPNVFFLSADFNRDGALDAFDFIAFQGEFAAQSPRADFDRDGAFTVFDFLAFQRAWIAGPLE